MNIRVTNKERVDKICAAAFSTYGQLSNEEINAINLIIIYDDKIEFRNFDEIIETFDFDMIKVYCSFDNVNTKLDVKCFNVNNENKIIKEMEVETM